MTCKNCSAEYDDKLEACPECSNGIESNSVATEEKVEEPCKDEAAQQAVTETEVKTEVNEEAQSEPSEAEVEAEEDVKVKKIPQKKRRIKTQAQLQAIKSHKRASAFIIVIMCLVAALAVALTVLNITTDIFEDDGSSEKVVAGIGFTSQEEKELEVLLAKTFSVSRKQYSKTEITVEEFLDFINPADSGNVYSRINGVSEALQTEPDPAERFADENGTYAYYKVEQSKIDAVLEAFNLESYRGENRENYYYCDGFYYFAAKENKNTTEVNAEIVKSRRVLDGRYYVEGYFYIEKQSDTVKTDNYHFVVEMTKDAETGNYTFGIDKVSQEPIFGSDGKLVNSSNNIVIQKESIEGRTDDGKLFCVYNLEFPVIEGSGIGYANVNDFFKNAVSVYELKASSAQQSYTEFKQNGGDESRLPLVENLIASVVFEDEKNISFVADFSRFDPSPKDGSETENNAADGVYKRSVEAYTFDKVSGNFVSKDDVLGKDYLLIGEILYRIYNGYDYESILPEENEEDSYSYDETPTDREGLGARIYESAWAYTEKGVTFYYQSEKGYVTEVTIPFKVVEKLK